MILINPNYYLNIKGIYEKYSSVHKYYILAGKQWRKIILISQIGPKIR